MLSLKGFVILTLDFLSPDSSAFLIVPLEERLGTEDLSSLLMQTPVVMFRGQAMIDWLDSYLKEY